ncbi:hypothetical protein [Nocardia wallacei]|uniref:hypothetical protein n=1 Tax=Nocardia wallacei TaxID=480035 RepID=UPI002454504C|nr:hypothetical protein [Nocardia wallacei]
MGMNAEQTPQPAKPVPITHAFRDLDSLLTERAGNYTYDVDAGLARLKDSLRARTTPATERQPLAQPTAATQARPAPAPAPACACRRRPDSLREWMETHSAPASRYATAFEETLLQIVSVNSHRFAARVAAGVDREDRWLVSWLPEVALTRKQAFSAMVIDEILLAHDLDSTTMLQTMNELAADLPLPLEKLLHRLALIRNPPPPPRWVRTALHIDTGNGRST